MNYLIKTLTSPEYWCELLALAVALTAIGGLLVMGVAFAHSKDDEMARIANPDFQTITKGK